MEATDRVDITVLPAQYSSLFWQHPASLGEVVHLSLKSGVLVGTSNLSTPILCQLSTTITGVGLWLNPGRSESLPRILLFSIREKVLSWVSLRTTILNQRLYRPHKERRAGETRRKGFLWHYSLVPRQPWDTFAPLPFPDSPPLWLVPFAAKSILISAQAFKKGRLDNSSGK